MMEGLEQFVHLAIKQCPKAAVVTKALRSRGAQFQSHLKAITNGEIEVDSEATGFVKKNRAHTVCL